MKTVSICIPTYEMHGLGISFLRKNFEVLCEQTFKDFDVIISDHSVDNSIEALCGEYRTKLDIHYYRNEKNRGNSSANINNAILRAEGKLIKILFQDDFLFNEHSLEQTVNAFDMEKDWWLVSASEHTKDGEALIRPFYPRYNRKIHTGENTISSPSVLTIKNGSPLLFDESLLWLMDCDYYKRCALRYGKPKILNTITVVNRLGNHQVSNSIISEEKKSSEQAYVKEKFKHAQAEPVELPNVTLVAVSSIKIAETIRALQFSMKHMRYKEVLLISDKKPHILPPGIIWKKCPPITSIDEYSTFMLYDLTRYIVSDYALVVQYDGYVLRPFRWDNRFFHYDYIGAPWEKDAHFTNEGVNVRVGNGGFSLRSKKLLDAFNELSLPFIDNGTGFYNEDGLLCNYYRKDLERHNIRYAPVAVASAFSCEVVCPDSSPYPFGFHKNTKLLPPPRQLRLFIQRQWSKIALWRK